LEVADFSRESASANTEVLALRAEPPFNNTEGGDGVVAVLSLRRVLGGADEEEDDDEDEEAATASGEVESDRFDVVPFGGLELNGAVLVVLSATADSSSTSSSPD